jgi:hypothetical protein
MGLSRSALTTIAERTGYPVRAAWVPGHGPMGKVKGVMLHHTATPASAKGDFPTLNWVKKGGKLANGKTLRGPLCNFGLGRSGTIYLVTEDRASHSGEGHYRGITAGNSHFLGIEGEHPGSDTAWPRNQFDAYCRLVASILHAIGRDTVWDIRHALWALPKGRKSDIKGFEMRDLDARVKQMLARPSTINRNRPG